MKKLFLLTVLFSFFSVLAFTQVPQPTMLSLSGIGGNSYDGINNVKKCNVGGFVVSLGSLSDHGTGNIDSFCSSVTDRNMFIKFNDDGTVVEWSKCFGREGDTSLNYIFPKRDGGFVLGGMYHYPWGFYICKQDNAANILWSHGYSYGNGLQITDMTETDDGGYLLLGLSYYTDTNVLTHYGDFFNADIFVLKLDSNGNKVWARVIGGTKEDDACRIIPAPGGGYYIAGSTLSIDYDCTGNHGGLDVYVSRLDINGNILWRRTFGGTKDEGACNAMSDGHNGLVIAAYTQSEDGDISHHIGIGDNVWIIDLDSSGTILWNQCYGGGNCYPNSVCRASNGSIWIAGVSQVKSGQIGSAYGSDDAWIVCTDSIGNFLSSRVLGSHGPDRGQMVFPLSNGHVLAGGLYSASDSCFNMPFYGEQDIFFAEFAPWDQTIVSSTPATITSLNIFPVPATDHVTIETNQKESSEILVTDIMGRNMYRTVTAVATTVAVQDWPRGLYYVQVIRNGEVRVGRISLF